MNLIKSCINYTGGKYKLLNQILPLFPKNINKFIDLFCGGCNVSLNVNANQIYCNDIEKEIINLFQFIKDTEINTILDKINDIIEYYELSNTFLNGYNFYKCDSNYGLSKYNKNNYIKLRDDFNKKNFLKSSDRSLYFFILVTYSFNNQIRFNKKNYFNVPVGKRDFNKNSKNNLIKFASCIKEKNFNFKSSDFKKFNLNDIGENDFLYLDPPYLITLASYNEQDGWLKKNEKDLLDLLDWIDSNNIRFALSNVLESKGKTNELLIDWSKNYNVNYLNHNYSNSNYQIKKNNKTVEVLICNY
ncbi:Dam family site-specific DNA-(adenine-N6)-methyltransferase [Methanobrevibacter sp. TMH8]|uniref:Dam family site-specific DNA-(adenine-N6)-methyltransferase n=1 Tax=Methanobrevibacter sp. TMH8 TaxID=2848611 RepID=UPI001CCACBFD|nr:Dam family site-specific DNA-(adenine-N6)-methyltransferase [Methanobrevibacter sp. TMH8]MBZ9570585.1 Dam family site-specific DNA-(adenine-N6)-methyltransferase [Methanobrevibacter sp. TMH8]